METRHAIVHRFLRTHPAQAARILDHHSSREILDALAEAPPDAAASTLSQLTGSLGAACLCEMDAPAAAGLLARMPPEAAARLLRKMEPGQRNAIIDQMVITTRQRMRRLLGYPEGTVGILMDPNPPMLAEDATVADALSLLAANVVTPGVVYVVDPRTRLAGTLAPAVLFESPGGVRVIELMTPVRHSLSPHDALPAAAASAAWMETDELPVVDLDGILQGVVRHRQLRAWAGSEPAAEGTDALKTALGLGELMWVGLFGLVEAMASTMSTEEGNQ